MKDFDAIRQARYDQQDPDFKIGGEVFRRKVSVRPEEIMEWEDLTGMEAASEQMRIIDNAVLAFIDIDDDPGAHVRYRNVRENAEPPLGVADIQSLLRWLIESNADRPTGRPGDSSPGPEAAGMTLTDGSSSPAVRAAPTI